MSDILNPGQPPASPPPGQPPASPPPGQPPALQDDLIDPNIKNILDSAKIADIEKNNNYEARYNGLKDLALKKYEELSDDKKIELFTLAQQSGNAQTIPSQDKFVGNIDELKSKLQAQLLSGEDGKNYINELSSYIANDLGIRDLNQAQTIAAGFEEATRGFYQALVEDSVSTQKELIADVQENWGSDLENKMQQASIGISKAAKAANMSAKDLLASLEAHGITHHRGFLEICRLAGGALGTDSSINTPPNYGYVGASSNNLLNEEIRKQVNLGDSISSRALKARIIKQEREQLGLDHKK